MNSRSEFKFHTLTPQRWADFEALFGERGACGGCWCMAWRLRKSEFDRNKGAGNKKRMAKRVKAGDPPGIIAYAGGEPVGWCAFGPRKDFVRLEASRVLKPIDDQDVWSITCFFIHKHFRRCGLSTELLRAVIAHARKRRVKILESYPVEPYDTNMPAVFAWTGFPSAFEKAGFVEVARRSPSRPIMRFFI